jgi:hypothetical protein
MTAGRDGDDGHRLDRLEAQWRFNGPHDNAPELRALGTAIAALAPPGVDAVAVGRAVFAAIRAARRDELAARELRERARDELNAILTAITRLRETAGDDALGFGRIAALLDHRDEPDAAAALTMAAGWLLGAGAAAEAVADARHALASSGRRASMARRIADRLVPVFEDAAGRPAAVTRDPILDETRGPFVALVDAAAGLAGPAADAATVGNAARAAVEQYKNSREKST